MISWKGDDEPAPTPEQLAAYADGELDGCPDLGPLRQCIEAWLARHPEAAADLEAQRRLAQLWQATTPPEPSEAAWQRVLDRLETPAPDGRGAVPRLAAWAVAALAAAAAAVWLALNLLRPADGPEVARQLPRVPGPPVRVEPPTEPVEPFAVATSDEVEILSIGGADTATVAVGELPLNGPMLLVQAGEVEVQRAEPEVRTGGNGSPMVWTPLATERVEP
jgi:hypothetical protein